MNRRARIKGIANIPVRNRNDTTAQKTEPESTENATSQPTEIDTTEKSTPDEIKTDNPQSEKVNTVRRWVQKPKPVPLALRRSKALLEPVKELPKVNIENECPKITDGIKTTPCEENEIKTPTINESVLKSPEPDRILTSPLSPNKILNRARIRPTPKLIRRNSVQGSASESEDDGRRSRIRTDSVCSTTSYTTDIITVKENTVISKDKLVSIKVHKLFRRSEQSKKVSEARRDFYQKFGSNIPDRKRLTMMDLIYYNPTTNPMPPRKHQTEVTIVEPEKIEEEVEDDPEESEDSNPVPQVKVGPNGEIILDEQSLVIEQTGMKKGREKLANSQIVNVDDLDRAYGIYKRPKRSKDWSAMETLRFYRSLNTVGTDFSLMVSLFPGRTRRELKMKFKKEEKINRQLIDKALTNPVDFDLSALEKQFKMEEEFMQKIEQESKTKKKERTKRKGKRSVFASQMDEEPNKDTIKVRKNFERDQKTSVDTYDALLNITELSTSESESEDEVIPRKKKRIFTGRDTIKENKNNIQNILLKQEKTNVFSDEEEENQDEEEHQEEEEAEAPPENDQNCVIPNILPNDLSTVEPGSLMILSTVGPDGQQIFKVFMVTPGQAKVPVNLSEDVVESLTTSLGSAEAVTLDLPVINDSDNDEEDT